MKLNKMIDHTILKANVSKAEVKRVCQEALAYDFASVCVNTCHVEFVAKQLKDSDVKTCVVVGFPLGAMITEAKAYETKLAVEKGAEEVDMVINIGALKDGDLDLVEADIRAVVEAAKPALVKVIIEACLLTDEEKIAACQAAVRAGADFVKTSTGFSTGGATAEDIALMRKTVGPDLGVKASGGVRTKEDAEKMIEAGATRIGASSSIAIVEGKTSESTGY